MHAEVDTCKKTDSEVTRWTSSSHAARLALFCRDWCTACFPQSHPVIKPEAWNFRRAKITASVFLSSRKRHVITSPIVSKRVRTYVAHARRSPQARRVPLMARASGSSFMAQGWIFLAWFRFTEPWSTRDRCQHRAVLSEHAQLRVKALMFV